MNKYEQCYYSLIKSRQNIIRDNDIVEKHHILPKSLGGSNSKDNLVLLTPREHFIAHLLLTKMYTGVARQKMLFAFRIMAGTPRRSSTGTPPKGNAIRYINNRLYQQLKEETNKELSKKFTGRIFSDTHRANLSKANKGKINTKSPEVIAEAAKKASLKLKGRKQSAEWVEKRATKRRGSILPEETVKKMKSAWTAERKQLQAERTKLQNSQRPILTCPHCRKSGTNPGNMNRYHFANCKCLQSPLNR